jgi:hypothetical protein
MIEGISLSANPYSPPPPSLTPRGWTAPAGAKASANGLVMNVRHDDTGRELREFYSVNGRKDWMAPYRAQPMEMMRINKAPSPESNAKFATYWQGLRAEGKI